MSSTFYRVMRTQPPVVINPSETIKGNMRGDALEMTVFFVGKGEAILLRRHNMALLIDAGVKGSVKSKALGEKLADYIKNPDGTGAGLTLIGLVSSHPHVDHIEAAPTVLAKIGSTNLSPMAKYYHNGFDVAPGLKPALDSAIQDAFGVARTVVVGDIGQHPNNCPIVPPLASDVTIRMAVEHDENVESNEKYRSIFMKVRFRKAKFIFTGDANTGDVANNEDYETRTLKLLPEPSHRQDVLKVTHHGSSDGTGDAFVSRTQPRISVASSDAASSHRLEQDVRDRLAPYSVVFDTQTAGGDIIIRTDGKRRNFDGEYGILYEVEEA